MHEIKPVSLNAGSWVGYRRVDEFTGRWVCKAIYWRSWKGRPYFIPNGGHMVAAGEDGTKCHGSDVAGVQPEEAP